MKRIYSVAALCVFIQLFALQSFSQNGKGKISGKIFDGNTNEPIAGCIVMVDGTMIGAQTNFDGIYEIPNLNSGTYKLVFKYISYDSKSVEGMSVSPGKTTTLNMAMTESSAALKEVMVTSTYKKESIGAMYSIQKNNIAISDGISSDIIKKSPDKNTSDVLKRVSGASIQDNKFVIIRGLNDRYNTATINNAMLPSSEPDRKAFSFDIIPSNLIDRITINKTASANLPGDFAGGVIQVVTRDIPDESFIDFSVSLGFNSQSTFKNFISNGRGKYDYLGFSDGERNISGSFPGSRKQYVSSTLAQKIEATKSLGNQYAEERSIALPSQSYQLTYGTKKDLQNKASFGSITSITYRNDQRINHYDRLDYDGPSSAYSYKNDQYRFNTNIGALANFTYLKGNNKISLKNIYNKIFDESYLERSGDNTNNLQSIRFNSNELTQKSLFNSQLEGTHGISDNKIKLNWNVNYASIISSQPDLRTIFYSRPIDQSDAAYVLVDRNSRRFFSELKEDNFGGNASVSIPFSIAGKNTTLKAGVLSLMKQRNFSARIFNYAKANFASGDSILMLDKGEIFADQNISSSGFVLNEFTNNSDKYFATSSLNVGYLMLDNQLTNRAKINAGLRLEAFTQNIDAQDATSAQVNSNNTYIDVLPSVNFTYEINSKTNYRVSGSKTVSRPEFRELAPFEFYDFNTASSLAGNPNLKRSENLNFDTRIEHYPSAGEALTATFFFKHFDNPIEQIVNSSSNTDLRRISYGNAKEAKSLGVEIEFRKKLSFLGSAPILENFTFYTNAAYIYSKVSLANQGGVDRALQGQSPYLINSGIQYSSADNINNISLLFNRVGERITIVGFQGYPDIYENARSLVDVQISRKVMNRKAEIKLNVSDLLNQKSIFYQNGDSKKSFNAANDRVINSIRFGTTVSIGFSYNLPLL